MSEVVERVARAMYGASMGRGLLVEPWDRLDGETRDAYIDIARAGIEAMREPTEGMIDRALIVNLKPSPDRICSTYLYDEEAREIWRDQIDEALK